jgi:hypothetical protein
LDGAKTIHAVAAEKVTIATVKRFNRTIVRKAQTNKNDQTTNITKTETIIKKTTITTTTIINPDTNPTEVIINLHHAMTSIHTDIITLKELMDTVIHCQQDGTTDSITMVANTIIPTTISIVMIRDSVTSV